MKKKTLFQFGMAAIATVLTACDNKQPTPVYQGGDKEQSTLVEKESSKGVAERAESTLIRAEKVESTLGQGLEVKPAPKLDFTSSIQKKDAVSFLIVCEKDPEDTRKDLPPVKAGIAFNLDNANVEVKSGKLIISNSKSGASLSFNMSELQDIQGLDSEFKLKSIETNIHIDNEGKFSTKLYPVPNSTQTISSSIGTKEAAYAINQAIGREVCIPTEGKKTLPKGPGALQITQDRLRSQER